MSPSERSRMASLDGALRRLDAAEAKALAEIRAAGFAVRNLETARAIQVNFAQLVRENAALIERMNDLMSGSTRGETNG